MYLTKISARSLKGGDFDLDLTQATVLVGDNFAGKTRIADAVRLLLLGYLPELGKRNSDTFGLASGTSMEVSGTFSTGATIRRRWFLKDDTVKKEEELPGEHDKIVPLLTVMLNAEEYFALSDRERVNYVFANCPVGNTDAYQKIPERVEKVAPGYNLERFTSVVGDVEPPPAYLEALIQLVGEDWKNAKAKVKQMEDTVRGLTDLRSRDVPARPLSTAEDAKSALVLAMADLNERKGILMTAYSAQHTAQLRRTALVRELMGLDAELARKAAHEQKLEALTRELDAAPVPEKSVIECATDVTSAQHTLNRACESIEHTTKEVTRISAETAEVAGQTVCPYCGASGDGWKALRLSELEKEMETVVATRDSAMAGHKKAQRLLQDAITLRDSVKAAFVLIGRLKSDIEATKEIIATFGPKAARAKALEEERDRLVVMDPELTAKVDTLNTELNVKQGELRTVELEIRAAAGRAGDVKRLAEAEIARDKAKADQELAKAAGTELRAIQGELVEAAFAPLLKTANSLFATVLKSPLCYRDGEIGTWRDAVWIGHRTMSGTEKLLTYAAIQAALAAKSPIRFMILDEMGRLTGRFTRLVGAALLDAIKAGSIDQVVCIDPERQDLYMHFMNEEENLAFTIVPIK